MERRMAMLNNRMLAVIKRELREKLLSKTFIFMTVLFPLLMFGIIGVQILMRTDEGNFKIDLVTSEVSLTTDFQNELTNSDLNKDGNYTFNFYTMDKAGLDEYLITKKKELLDGKINGIIYIPSTALKDKRIEYYSKTPKDISLSRRLSGPVNKVLIDNYFNNRNLSKEELDFARKGVDFAGFKISKEEGIEEEGYGNLVLSYVFTFLLYISLLMTGQMMMQSVIEEKSNRIVEIILSSVSAKELMAGKIIGSTITALIQMAIWLSPIMMIISTTWIALPAEISFNITMNHILYLLLNFGLGLFTFLGLFAMMGSIFDNPQDAQSGMWPVMLLIIIPFLMAISMMENPNSPIANVASLLPFASIMIMPVKMTVVEVPAWQLILCLVINTATIFAIFPIAGKIYRIGILRTGKKPKWSEVVKWLKYKY
ncbi:MAG: ABC transporter permease [Ignavibacteria bacterium]|nr:ABC transporter permease [Ignavibacteria bacterium]